MRRSALIAASLLSKEAKSFSTEWCCAPQLRTFWTEGGRTFGSSSAPCQLSVSQPGIQGRLCQAVSSSAVRTAFNSQTRSMFIQTQPTPNPSSLMFVPGRQVMESGTYEFSNSRSGMVSPLAKRLFTIDGVQTVFFGSDFITVTKKDDTTWAVLKPDIFAAIQDHFASNEPLFTDADTLAHSDTAIHPDDDEVVAMIKELLETRIRPAVQEDGGDIVYKGFDPDTGTVTLKMMVCPWLMLKFQGACSGCPSSAVTLKSGIENMLMHYIPEVKNVVEAEPDESENEGLKEFKKLEQHLSA